MRVPHALTGSKSKSLPTLTINLLVDVKGNFNLLTSPYIYMREFQIQDNQISDLVYPASPLFSRHSKVTQTIT